jgi:hypothetical protein
MIVLKSGLLEKGARWPLQDLVPLRNVEGGRGSYRQREYYPGSDQVLPFAWITNPTGVVFETPGSLRSSICLEASFLRFTEVIAGEDIVVGFIFGLGITYTTTLAKIIDALELFAFQFHYYLLLK